MKSRMMPLSVGLVRRREVALVDVFDENPFDRAVPAAACGNASFFDESDHPREKGRDIVAAGVNAKPA